MRLVDELETAQGHHRSARLVRRVSFARRAQEDDDSVFRQQGGARLGSQPRTAAPVALARRHDAAAPVQERRGNRSARHREAVRCGRRQRLHVHSRRQRFRSSADGAEEGLHDPGIHHRRSALHSLFLFAAAKTDSRSCRWTAATKPTSIRSAAFRRPRRKAWT